MANKIPGELDGLFEELLGSDRRHLYKDIGQKLPHYIRFNPLKGSPEDQQAFFREQGFKFTPLDNRKDIFRIEYQPYPIGKSLSHFLGHIYVQDIASMIPAIVLDPQPGDRVLDISAAPGSKTTLMGGLMQNKGLILANDIVAKRLRALGKNLERMGIINALMYRWFGEQLGNAYFEVFDRVLLDPACSGLGTLHKNPEILNWWTTQHCERLAASQKNLMISAIKSLRPGGALVYSTCTLTPKENEEIVNFALSKYPMEIETIELQGLKTWPGLIRFGDQTFHPEMEKTVRLYPIEQETEGFYVAKLRKTASLNRGPRQDKSKEPRRMTYFTYKTSPVKKYIDYLINHFEIPQSVFKDFLYTLHTDIFCISKQIADFPIFGAPLQMGLPLIKKMDRGGKLNSAGCQLLGKYAGRMTLELPDLETLQKFVNRQLLDIPVEKPGQHIIKYRNIYVGYGIAEKGRLKSQFPKADWPIEVVGDWNTF